MEYYAAVKKSFLYKHKDLQDVLNEKGHVLNIVYALLPFVCKSEKKIFVFVYDCFNARRIHRKLRSV